MDLQVPHAGILKGGGGGGVTFTLQLEGLVRIGEKGNHVN